MTAENTPRAPRRWSDDPWSALTTGEAEAWREGFRLGQMALPHNDVWRAGYEVARKQATRLAGQVPIPEYCSAIEAHGRLSAAMDAAHAIAAMEPPA